MRYSVKQYSRALYLALEESSLKEKDNILTRFAKVLEKNNDLSLGRKIVAQFEKISREAKGVRRVDVVSARKLPERIVSQIREKFGQRAEINQEIDSSILGGMKILIDGERFIDASFSGRINKLMENLKTQS